MTKDFDQLFPAPLTGSLRDYRALRGNDLLARTEDFFRWQNARRDQELWPYSRMPEQAPMAQCTVVDDAGRRHDGINFGSQDYLSLSSHPRIKEAAHEAIDAYGVHSAGSSAFLGNTSYSIDLQAKIADFLQMEHTVLYPTGWAAGYGAIRGLVGPADHIVIDRLAHNCLQDGAVASTRNIHVFRHNELDSVRRHLKRIRSRDPENGILVVTEGLFSMDSDSPDIGRTQDLCREYNAALMVDVAHDLGNLGPGGRGQVGLQGMLGKVDIMMGSFSKSFASNGGFVACHSPSVREYLRYYGSSGIFSNAMSPVQGAVVLEAFKIIDSVEGDKLRSSLMANILRLRSGITEAGLDVWGEPSAIVPVQIGDEALARLMSRRLAGLGLIANLVEYPAVAKSSARFRLQVMANHDFEQVDRAVALIKEAYADAKREFESLPPEAVGEHYHAPVPDTVASIGARA